MVAQSKSGAQPPKVRQREVTVYGFGRRLGAALIDAVIVIFLAWVFAILASVVGWLFTAFNSSNPPPVDTLIILSALVVSVFYFIAAWAREGATIGQSLLGMKVVRPDGAKLNLTGAILRYVGYIVSGLLLSLGFLWINFDARRQGWHDKIARTIVINSDDDYRVGDTLKLLPNDADRPRRYLWVVLWFVLLVVAPGALFSSLIVLGPVISRWAQGILQGIVAR
jgi:uncharacterized RDD family membrane protein YckC